MSIPYIRLLLWLKWTLLWRGFSRDRMSLAGTVLAMLVIWPWSILLAFGISFAFINIHPPNDQHLLTAVLSGAYLFWIVTPLMGYALNDSYDITRLFVYPLSMRQILMGAILGSVLNFPTLFLLPMSVVCVAEFTTSAAAGILVIVAMGVFLFHTLALSQSILLLSAGILRSRKFRDIILVLLPFLWLGYYVFRNFMAQSTAQVDWQSILRSERWDWAVVLPPGIAARAIASAGHGNYLLSFLFLILLAGVAAGAIYLCAWILERLYQGEGGETSQRDKRKAATRTERPASARAGILAALPPVIQAMVAKESRYLRRDPAFKVSMMNLVYMLALGIVWFVRRDTAAIFSQMGPVIAWIASGWVLFSESNLLFNIFGADGGAASTLFLFPSPRNQILLGKNLTLFIVLSAVHFAFSLILSALANAFEMFVPLFIWMELALIVFMAVGNLVSIHLPMRTAMIGRRARQQSFGQGCGYAFLYLVLTGVAIGLTLPALACVLIPAFFVAPTWYALTIPIASIYAVAIYVFGLRLAADRLLSRETEIAMKISTADA